MGLSKYLKKSFNYGEEKILEVCDSLENDLFQRFKSSVDVYKEKVKKMAQKLD